MNENELLSLATFASILLVVSTSIQGNWIGLVFGVVSTMVLIFASVKVSFLLSAMIVVPVILQVRWCSRKDKDLVSGVLAAAVVATATAKLLAG